MATALDRLRQLVRIPTISRLDPAHTDWEPFDRFVSTLEKLYPKTHETLEREVVAGHSLLFRWRGRSEANPSVLMAHYDVVSATDEGWEHPPFSAELTGEGDEQLLWGRGTLDDKGALVAATEGVEAAIAAGYEPENDLYLSFGHDEETVGGGAKAIVDLLASRGVTPGFVLDEGGAVIESLFPGVSEELAVVGVCEKGIMSLRLVVEQDGGHASTPPRLTATARLARAIHRLNSRPFPTSFTPTNLEMIRTVGAHARQPYRWVFTNLWLTRLPLLALFNRLGDETRAIIRTTQAVTMMEGSQAVNALAERALAVVNIRVAIDSSVEKAVAHVRRAIRDPKVMLEVLHPNEPSPVSPTTGRPWELISAGIESAYPGVIVTPYVMLGASDSRQFNRISSAVYRFSPFRMSKEERGGLHAMNERMRVSTFLSGVAFYSALVQRL